MCFSSSTMNRSGLVGLAGILLSASVGCAPDNDFFLIGGSSSSSSFSEGDTSEVGTDDQNIEAFDTGYVPLENVIAAADLTPAGRWHNGGPDPQDRIDVFLLSGERGMPDTVAGLGGECLSLGEYNACFTDSYSGGPVFGVTDGENTYFKAFNGSTAVLDVNVMDVDNPAIGIVYNSGDGITRLFMTDLGYNLNLLETGGVDALWENFNVANRKFGGIYSSNSSEPVDQGYLAELASNVALADGEEVRLCTVGLSGEAALFTPCYVSSELESGDYTFGGGPDQMISGQTLADFPATDFLISVGAQNSGYFSD